MQASQIPVKMPLVFAQNAGSGYIRTVPNPSQIMSTPGAASFNDGFPPLTFSSPLVGGVPPDGRDFNGLLNAITAWNQWQQLGGPVTYDSTFQAAVSGYPKGAVVQSATSSGTFWLCTTDNNTTNPDTGGAGWVDVRFVYNIYAVASGPTNAWVASPPVAIPSLTDGVMIRVRFAATNSTASPTINVSTLGAVTIYDRNGVAGLPANWLPLEALLQYNSACSGWCCLNSSPVYSDTIGGVSLVQTYNGNPNGHLSGNASVAGVSAPSMAFDITENVLWVCTTTGTTTTAVWQPIMVGFVGILWAGVSGGSANAQTLTPTPALSGLAAGVALSFQAGFSNTAALTINVSGLGAKNVYKDGPAGPVALTGGEIIANQICTIRYDGTQWQLTSTELGTAALANASSNTGKVAAVTGSSTSGHIAVFSDSLGTIQDGGPLSVPQGLYVNSSGTLFPGVYIIDTTAGPITATLASGQSAGAGWIFIDGPGSWAVNNFTVAFPTYSLAMPYTSTGLPSPLTCNVPAEEFLMWFDGTNLRMF